MKQQAGFTLIELVIVIVILGILGAVAAPRFINLQGDAYKANVNALKGSLQSAATLGNTKAILAGKDKKDDKVDIDGTEVEFVAGYPAASVAGILKMLQDDETSFSENGDTSYNYKGDEGVITINPKGRDSECFVKYQQAVAYKAATGEGADTEASAPKITTKTGGC